MEKEKTKKIIILSTVFGVMAALFLVYLIFDFPSFIEPVQQESDLEQKEYNELLIEDLLIEDLLIGEGPRLAEYGETVSVHYVGMLLDGSVFDSSIEKGRPFTFRIGDGTVIKGWEIGVEGMRVGGKRRLTIPPDLAYGQGGVRDIIPPNSTIFFEIELLEIKE